MNDQYPAEWQAHDDRIRPYRRYHRAVHWAQNIASLAFLAGWFCLGWGRSVEAALSQPGYFAWLAYFAALGLCFELISLPFSILSQKIERHFALSKQPWSDWWLDHVKGLGVGVVLGAVVVGLLYAAVLWFSAYWWVAAAVGFITLSVILAQLAPVLLLPLFLKLDPLPEGDVRRRIFALCEKHGVVVREVYRLGLGAKTEKGNAAFMGLGRTKRIAIGDTILEKYPQEEVEAVFAHELGHQVHGDIWRGLFLSTLALFVTFAAAAVAVDTWITPMRPEWVGTPTGILAFFVVLGIVQYPVGVLQAIHSRWREREADRFASEQEGLARPLAAALERLTYQNWGPFRPHPWVEFFTYSHPSPRRRILRLRGTI